MLSIMKKPGSYQSETFLCNNLIYSSLCDFAALYPWWCVEIWSSINLRRLWFSVWDPPFDLDGKRWLPLTVFIHSLNWLELLTVSACHDIMPAVSHFPIGNIWIPNFLVRHIFVTHVYWFDMRNCIYGRYYTVRVQVFLFTGCTPYKAV